MLLYHSPTSPFVRKVEVLLRESGLDDRVRRETVGGNPIDPRNMPVHLNPLGKIPALALDDGRVLYDSRVICRYLDQRAGAGFYPATEALWDVLVVEALADGITDAAVLMVYETRLRPEPIRFAPWVEGQWQKVARGLDEMERRWLPLLQGPMTMAQIAAGCALGYLDFRHPERGWREGRPGLAAWEEGFRARPAMAATVPVG